MKVPFPNQVSPELLDKMRGKYSPKRQPPKARPVRVIKKSSGVARAEGRVIEGKEGECRHRCSPATACARPAALRLLSWAGGRGPQAEWVTAGASLHHHAPEQRHAPDRRHDGFHVNQSIGAAGDACVSLLSSLGLDGLLIYRHIR